MHEPFISVEADGIYMNRFEDHGIAGRSTMPRKIGVVRPFYDAFGLQQGQVHPPFFASVNQFYTLRTEEYPKAVEVALHDARANPTLAAFLESRRKIQFTDFYGPPNRTPILFLAGRVKEMLVNGARAKAIDFAELGVFRLRIVREMVRERPRTVLKLEHEGLGECEWTFGVEPYEHFENHPFNQKLSLGAEALTAAEELVSCFKGVDRYEEVSTQLRKELERILG